MTNIELVEFAKKALKENWGYCLGAYGNVLTPTFLSQKLKQAGGVGTYNTKHKTYLNKFLNKRVTDCYGLIKAFVWWNGGNIKYVAAQDKNATMAYNAAKEKGPLMNMPEIPGLVLWMTGHAGVYIGGGEFIECAGAPTGMRKGKIQNGKVITGSKFTHWFKDTLIDYTSKLKIKTGNKHYLVDGHIKDGVSYFIVDGISVPLRAAAEALGLTVGWHEGDKEVLLNVKA